MLRHAMFQSRQAQKSPASRRRSEQAALAEMGSKKAAGGPAAVTFPSVSLFRRDLLWWVERAGIVDLLDLVVGEAKNLPQNFVRMLA
jgi:hypothetical protein